MHVTVHNYQIQVSQCESSSIMALVDKNEEAQQQLFQKFQKQKKNFIKINNNSSNHVYTQVVATTLSVAPFSSIFTHHNFTPLSKSLHSIMLRLSNTNMMKLPPIKPIYTSKPFPSSFDHKSFFQYHYQIIHDTERCYKLKHFIQDLIDSNIITMDGVKDKGNKSATPANQNLKIFINPLPSHYANVVEPKKPNYMIILMICV